MGHFHAPNATSFERVARAPKGSTFPVDIAIPPPCCWLIFAFNYSTPRAIAAAAEAAAAARSFFLFLSAPHFSRSINEPD
jgi:hypothetical protein